jgi:hypothetical protein
MTQAAKRKVRRGRLDRGITSGFGAVVYAPIVGEGLELRPFILIDLRKPCPIRTPGRAVYMRTVGIG